MKKIYFSVCLVLATLLIQAQIPAGFNYQAVIRNETGELVKNKTIGIQFSILKDSESGSLVYSEVINPTTNLNGLVTAEIGKANQAQFSQIDWSDGIYFLKTETDINSGTNYTISGVSQLLSVPYAMYAEKSGDGLKITGTPQPGDILYNNGLSWGLLPKGVNGQTLRIDNGQPKWGEPGYALPMVTTNIASDVLQTGATSGGNVIATGYSDITARGVCWSTAQNPTIADSKTTEPVGIGTYTSKLTNLLANTTYYARAYATNAAGTAYGNQVTFKTFLTVVFPTVTTSAAINISENAATSGGNVTATGGAEVTAKGLCWGTNQNPTISDNKTIDGEGTGQFDSQMTKLVPGTTYYVRAYASNSAGTGYGNQVTLTTLKTIPTVVTKNITSISAMGGVSGGTITISGGGTISDKGICWGESENPTVNDNKISAGTGIAAFNSAINLLKPNTTCYVRSYAINEIGIAYGEQKTFKTSDAFYDGFETGFSGTTGGWGIITGDAVEGAYSLYTNRGAEASLTRTLANDGQINFYAKCQNSSENIAFYIDNELKGTYSNNFWGLQSYPVTAGSHTFKWIFNKANYNTTNAWIDFIVMPK